MLKVIRDQDESRNKKRVVFAWNNIVGLGTGECHKEQDKVARENMTPEARERHTIFRTLFTNHLRTKRLKTFDEDNDSDEDHQEEGVPRRRKHAQRAENEPQAQFYKANAGAETQERTRPHRSQRAQPKLETLHSY